LTEQWFYDEKCSLKVYLFDSHRPYSHNNVIDPYKKVLKKTI